MNTDEAKQRAQEQLEEADSWILLTRQFFSESFDSMVCPHCRATSFEYMIHQRTSFTLRCQACGRFTHGRGAPSWALDQSHPDGVYVPLPRENPGATVSVR